MLRYLYVGTHRLPAYGMIVLAGVVLCNLLALLLMRQDRREEKEFYFVTVPAMAGAVIGAKLLSIVEFFLGGGTAAVTINFLKEAGCSFYGGLAGLLFSASVMMKIMKKDEEKFWRAYLFLLPLMLGIWKLGCFTAGCCFGIPYDGPLSVCYEPEVNALSGVPVFPVQLLEAGGSFLLAGLLLFVRAGAVKAGPVGLYLTLYGVFRFFCEFFRYHENKTVLSCGQLWSVLCGGIGIIILLKCYRRGNGNE